MSLPLLSPPAGLSSDTLDPPIPTHIMREDHWSDGHENLETDEERAVIREIHEEPEDLTIQHSKLATTGDKAHEVNTPSPTTASPNDTQQRPAAEAEAGSVHSLPVVHVTEPSSPSPAPMTSRSTSSTFPASPASSLAPTVASSQERRARNRLTLDVSA
jgi:hypothetical protein